MDNEALEKLKYPIGKFVKPDFIDDQLLQQCFNDIETLPTKLKAAVKGLTEEQLNTPYRPDGWTVKQVVHHVCDSHLNSYIRFKWALTEDTPVIKTYSQALWAGLKEYELLSVEDSLAFIEVLHKRLITLLRSLTKEELEREFIHPEMKTKIKLRNNIALYAWHSKHHTAHITSLRKRNGW
jgi:uncharacterized damage-inducible protein DinB